MVNKHQFVGLSGNLYVFLTTRFIGVVAPSFDLTSVLDVSRLCEVKSEDTGEVIKVKCSLANETVIDEEMFGNVTVGNVTKHCSKSEFGCCPDWTTPAEGRDNAGCPEFILGNSILHFL